MAYTKQTWQDNNTAYPLSAARMTVIENGIFDANNPAAATGTTIVYSSKVTGDTNNRLERDANGKLSWGPGNAAADTVLYRSAANTLHTDDQLWVRRTAVSDSALVVEPGTDANPRFVLRADGQAEWGDGTATRDTNLYRSAANKLKTDDALDVAGTLTALGAVAAPATYVTALPGSPVDGQEVFYAADAANSIIWHLRYRTSLTRWEFVGGSPLRSSVATSESLTSSTYGDLTTVGPSLTVPLTGTYRIALGSRIGVNNTANTFGAMSIQIGGTAAVDADRVAGNTFFGSHFFRWLPSKSLTASTALTAKYKSSDNATNVTWEQREIQLVPVFI